METFLWLAEAGAEAEEGFGLNLDIFSTNLINLAIVIGVLFYFGKGFLGKILSERRSNIETAIREAEQKAAEAKAALSEAEENLKQAQATAERLRSEAQERAQAVKEQVMAEARADIERLKTASAQEMQSSETRAMAELRQRAVALAVEEAETYLRDRLDDKSRDTIVDRSISLIGGQ